MKLKSGYTELALFFAVLLILSYLISTVHFDTTQDEPLDKDELDEIIDNPSILPDWRDGIYHDSEGTKQKIMELNEKYPNLINYFSLGKSVLNKDILCMTITNESNKESKYSCLIDGCIHGNEWESGEACLYLAEYLLINYGHNSTITNILDKAEIYIVPLMNPDGRDDDTRWNENGIDLNRNFDVHFGRIKGGNYRLGKLFGFIKIPYIKFPFKGTYTNCGRKAFSEPETRAIKELAETLKYRDFSFYLNCHTAMHGIGGPNKVTTRPEFTLTQNEIDITNYVLDWVDENTEYEAYYAHKNEGIVGCGFANDWFFKTFRIPSFCYEIMNTDYEPWLGSGKHDHLVHWMKTTLPVFMYLLVNIENLHNWETPDNQPLLPEGIPPNPLK